MAVRACALERFTCFRRESREPFAQIGMVGVAVARLHAKVKKRRARTWADFERFDIGGDPAPFSQGAVAEPFGAFETPACGGRGGAARIALGKARAGQKIGGEKAARRSLEKTAIRSLFKTSAPSFHQAFPRKIGA